jgi:hypothetical protein
MTSLAELTEWAPRLRPPGQPIAPTRAGSFFDHRLQVDVSLPSSNREQAF